MAGSQICVLGSICAEGAQVRVALGSAATLRMLAALVVAGGLPVHATQLTARVWGDAAAPSSRLRMTAMRLRSRLADAGLPDAIVAEAGGYRLAVPDDQVDAHRFERTVRVARERLDADPAGAAALLEEALELWRGDPFEPISSEPWLAGTVQRLAELRLTAEEALGEAQLRSGQSAEVVDRLLQAAEDQPLREARWVQLAVALDRAGRRTEALRAVHRARTLLRDHAGLEPGPALLEVERDLVGGAHADGPDEPMWREQVELVGRDVVLAQLAQTFRQARVVTVLGPGGIGKSAVARTFGQRCVRDGMAVLSTRLDGISSPSELRSALSRAVGLEGTDDPAGLVDAIARRVPPSALWILDGAEDARVALDDVLPHLLEAEPSLRLLVTSREPLEQVGGVRVALDPLEIGSADAPGPAMQLFSVLAGLAIEVASEEDRAAVAEVCALAEGVPLALELLAGSAERLGLREMVGRSPQGGGGIDTSVSVALGALTPACRRVVTRLSRLPHGMGTELALAVSGASSGSLARLLAPAVHERLLAIVPTGGGVRYRLAEPVRQVISATSSPDEVAELIEVFRTFAADVGDLHGAADARALERLRPELDNLRHLIATTGGSEPGLRLVVAASRAFGELGLGAEGSAWLEEHLAASPTATPLLRARAAIASAWLRGELDVAAADVPVLRSAVAAAEAAGDWRLWLLGSELLAVAVMWTGADNVGGLELLVGPTAQERLDLVGDEWFRVHRMAIGSMAPAAGGHYQFSRACLDGLADRYLALGDVSSALDVLFRRAFLARADGDIEGAAGDLDAAREIEGDGLALGTVALLEAEEAHLARARSDPGAIELLAAAVDRLERAGSTRVAAAHRRDLGGWRAEDGDARGARDDLRAALPTLLRQDRRGAALALAALAELSASARARARLAGAAASVLRDATGAEPTPAQQAVLARVVGTVLDAASAAELEDEAILDIAGVRSHPAT